MRVSAIPVGVKFKYVGVEYMKTNHNRGVRVINGKQVFKSFGKHIEAEVGKIIYKGKLCRL